MLKPITPREVKAQIVIPDGVFAAFNALIVKYYDGNRASFSMKEAAKAIATQMKCSQDKVYNKHWLDVESHYAKVGWIVRFNNTGYNETGDETFTFEG